MVKPADFEHFTDHVLKSRIWDINRDLSTLKILKRFYAALQITADAQRVGRRNQAGQQCG